MQKLIGLALIVTFALLVGWAVTREGPVPDARALNPTAIGSGDLTPARGLNQPGHLERIQQGPAARAGLLTNSAPPPSSAAPLEPEMVPLAGPTSVHITVLSSVDESPLPWFKLRLQQPMVSAQTAEFVTDDLGQVSTPSLWSIGTLFFEGPSTDMLTGSWELSPAAISIPPGVTERQVTLHASPVDVAVSALVLLPDGDPLPGAEVCLALGDQLEGGRVDWQTFSRELAGGDGRARFFVRNADRERPMALFLFNARLGWVSDPVRVETLLDGDTILIEVYRPGALHLLVRDSQGLPISQARALLGRSNRLGSQLTRASTLGADGSTTFADLPAGEYLVSVEFEGSARGVGRRSVQVGRGERIELALVLSDEDKPQLAVAGDVIDEEGNPVPGTVLSVQLADGSRQYVIGDANGHFEYYATPVAGDVIVNASASVFADVYDPNVIKAPFGTAGLVLRRLKELEEVVVLFEVVDAQTGQAIGDKLDPCVSLHHPPDITGHVHGVARFGMTDGVSEVDFKPHPGLAWYVVAPGYREARGKLRAPEKGASPGHQRVELMRGFERSMVVRDIESNEPLSGVQFIDDQGHILGTSDRAGQVVLLSDVWPSGPLQATLAGYASQDWNASGYWSHHEASIWLRKQPSAAVGEEHER